MSETFPSRYSEQDASRARLEPVRLAVDATASPRAVQDPCFGYFVGYLQKHSQLRGDGLTIETTIDPDLQRAVCAEAARSGEEFQAALGADAGRIEIAIVMLTPDGQIRAMTGGRDFRVNQFNIAAEAKRSPGSVVKPLLLLDALTWVRMADGDPLTAATVFDAGRDEVPGEIEGIASKFAGRATLRAALAVSDNRIPAFLGHRMGWDRVGQVLGKALGSNPPRSVQAILGAGDGSEVSPLAVASAYTVFANGGRRAAPRFITAEIRDGKRMPGQVAEWDTLASPQATIVIGDMLRDVTGKNGTAKGVREAAGLPPKTPLLMKTGSGQVGDLWAVAVMPKLITVVWVGGKRPIPLPYVEGWSGGTTAAPVWARLMRSLRQRRDLLEGSFPVPAGVARLAIDPERGCIVTGGGVLEYFLQARLPPVCP